VRLARPSLRLRSANNRRILGGVMELNFSYLWDGALHAVMGVVLFAISLWVFDQASGRSVRKQVVEEKNTAAAILAGFVALALGVIVAASVH